MNTRTLYRRVWFSAVLGLTVAVPALAELRGVTPDEADQLIKSGVPVVDVRTPKEWQETGVIPGSYKLTFFDEWGQYDTRRWLRDLKTALAGNDKPLVLVCRSGNRSATVGKILSDEYGFKQVYHVEKGVREWRAEGKRLTPAPCTGHC